MADARGECERGQESEELRRGGGQLSGSVDMGSRRRRRRGNVGRGCTIERD